MNTGFRAIIAVSVALSALTGTTPNALGHGDEPPTPPSSTSGGTAMGSEEAEIAALAKQPARVLAQQALALLRVHGPGEDHTDALHRTKAGVASDDKADVDAVLLERANVALSKDEYDSSVELLDRALSRPLGAESGKALHEAGREFQPATGTQEVVGIIAGAVLLLVGVALLLKDRRRVHAA